MGVGSVSELEMQGFLKRKVGLALSDTPCTQTRGQKNGEKIEPKIVENFGTKTGIIFVPDSQLPPGQADFNSNKT